MSYSDPKLLKIASQGGKFLKIGVGESFVGRYMGYDTSMDEKYNKMKVVFKLKNKDGKVKELSTSSKKVISKFAKIAPGSVIKLVKLGEGTDTDYQITLVKEAKMPAVTDDVETVDEEVQEDIQDEPEIQTDENWPDEEDDEEADEEESEDDDEEFPI